MCGTSLCAESLLAEETLIIYLPGRLGAGEGEGRERERERERGEGERREIE